MLMRILFFLFLPVVMLMAQDKELSRAPTLWLVGDSTVNVSTPGQTGWGEVIDRFLEPESVRLANHAIGGRSSRTFITEGRWQAVLEAMVPGDIVIIQFGHNDAGNINDDHRARGTIRGIGDESIEIDNMLTGRPETVYSYGHYLRRYVRDARERGAVPVVASLVPRKIWEDGRIRRDRESYAGWAEAVARESGAHFIDLNEIIARGYEALGAEAVEPFFADARTHTTEAGAVFNARAVVAGLRGLPNGPFDDLLSPAGKQIDAYPPREWIDPRTGHRVLRLSEEPGTASLYFHQHAFTPDGRVIVTTPRGIATIDLESRVMKGVVLGEVNVIQAGRASSSVYYTRGEGGVESVFVVNPDDGAVRKIADLPPGGAIASVNADETLLLGSRTLEEDRPLADGPADAAHGGSRPQGEWMQETDMRHPRTGEPLTFAEQKEWRLNARLEARIPMEMFVIDSVSGERRVVHEATDWLNHLQFSPTDPLRILFCHEGPWHKVDRIWTLRIGDAEPDKVHARTMNMEIAGHEFFGQDGESVWYDLQTPRGEVFWLASYHLESARRSWYALERDEWSVHFNVSPDGRYFAGDGGDAEMVAKATDGKWIYLFELEAIPDVAGISAPNSEDLVHPGRLRARRLVDMRHHDYRLEPNVMFTPDSRRVIFRSNMHGATHVYAVDVAPSEQGAESAGPAPERVDRR